MAKSVVALRIDLARARAHWHKGQGLATPLDGRLEDVIAATGWPRTLGGVDVYLATRARVPTLRRKDLEEAVASSRLQVIPAVRGCIYLVPRADVPLALRVAEEPWRKQTDRELAKLGVKPREIDDLADAVIGVLAKGALATDAIRRALPTGAVRSLGDAGKKLGVSSPLPVTLRHLELGGRIERTLPDGRLDSERYTWRRTVKSPFAGAKVPATPDERHARLATIFFGSAGPATTAELASWSGLGQRDARAAVERAGLIPVAIDGHADEAFALPAHREELASRAPASTSVSFLSFEDNYLVVHGGTAPVLDPVHHDHPVSAWGGDKATTLGAVRHPGMRMILVGDRIAGLWEHDRKSGRIVTGGLSPFPAKIRRAVEEASLGVAALLGDLGHARAFSLDNDDEIAARAERVKALT